MKKVVILTFIFVTFNSYGQSDMSSYKVQRLAEKLPIDAQWDKAGWEMIPAVELSHHMGDRPVHFPKVQAKMAYDKKAIYVIFRVEDKFVKAVHNRHQEGVFKDSCVEFFFSPASNSTNGYFNLEMNCGGTMLFHHQIKPREGSVHIEAKDIDKIKVAHSLPLRVDPEIQDPVTWTVEYRIPFNILEKYRELTRPDRGTIWRANFYKCADDTSHPHWLTWSPVNFPRPNFHLPEFFGTLEFQ